jgi:four helix bundle protein
MTERPFGATDDGTACDLTVKSIYIETKDLRDFGFKDQITRSGLSVPSNIADKNAGATF